MCCCIHALPSLQSAYCSCVLIGPCIPAVTDTGVHWCHDITMEDAESQAEDGASHLEKVVETEDVIPDYPMYRYDVRM